MKLFKTAGVTLAFIGTLLLFGATAQPAQAAPPGIVLLPLAADFSSFGVIMDISSTRVAGDTRVFVVSKSGPIRVVQANGAVNGTPFLDLTGKVRTSGEGGAAGIVFDPGYATNGRFFVSYAELDGDLVLSRFTVSGNPDVADTTETKILTVTRDASYVNHYGADLHFGPDGMLYMSTGDGSVVQNGLPDTPNNAQNKNSLLGKILRLDVSGAGYAVPPGNPFIGQDGADEVWHYGFRNPWKFSFDRADGGLFIGDVGEGQREEVDYQAAGAAGGLNYGWRCYEGSLAFNFTNSNGSACSTNMTRQDPIHEYDHTSSRCSITGGYVYRGVAQPGLQGRYIFTDWCSGHIYSMYKSGPNWVNDEQAGALSSRRLTTFGEDAAGELYAGSSSGKLYQVVETPVPYRAEHVRQSASPTVDAGDQTTVTVDYRNTGTQTWSNTGSNPVRIGTDRPQNRSSSFASPDWVSPGRPATFAGKVDTTGATLTPSATIAPGETARFQFTMTAPPVHVTQTINEHFQLLAEGVVWFADVGQHFPVTVNRQTYEYSHAGQVNPPSSMNGGDTATVSVDLTNTGQATWRSDGQYPLRLGTSHPMDRGSGFAHSSWLSQNRTGSFLGKVVGGSVTNQATIAPGETGRFQFTMAPNLQSGSYQEYFQPLVEGFGWMQDIGIYFPTTVSNPNYEDPDPTHYAYQYVGQTNPPAVMVPGQRATLTLDLQNTGSATWRRTGSFPFHIGTSRPLDRVAPTAALSAPNAWISATRLGNFSGKVVGGVVTNQDTVAPGETARFTFDVVAPATPNTYREYLRPLVEGSGWLFDIGIYYDVRVPSLEYDYEYVSQTNPPATVSQGSQHQVTIRLRNTGRQTWTTSGSVPLRLGTSRPMNRPSAFAGGAGWLGNTRIVLQSTTAPGAEGVFVATFTAPNTPGTYNEYFQPVAETFTWLRDIGIYVPFQVQ